MRASGAQNFWQEEALQIEGGILGGHVTREREGHFLVLLYPLL